MLHRAPQWKTYAGRHKRIFSNKEEVSLAFFVRDNFIAPGLIFTDSNFLEIVMNIFLLKYQDAGHEMPMFQSSTGFMTQFKTRHHQHPEQFISNAVHPSQTSSDRDGSAPSRSFCEQCPGIESPSVMRLHGSFILMTLSHGRTSELRQYKHRLMGMKRKTLWLLLL
jgi:hypothetical protein